MKRRRGPACLMVETLPWPGKSFAAMLIAMLALSTMRLAPAPPVSEIFNTITAEAFGELDRAKERIPHLHPDAELLSAAVLHETNQRRKQNLLPPLLDDHHVREAARLQSAIMAERGTISHTNPGMKQKETLADRLRLTGLGAAAFSAENVATAFGLEYLSGQMVYAKEGSSGREFSLQPDGPPLLMHTYRSFASSLLDTWMASPSHRSNILSPHPQY